ncbi:FtsX-like permease family protein [Paenibacillus methanolicus]|uniref:Putative hemin transport system permease protein HrtB n=1 Tax=Paenibacillus methanolicus TaxID=582686 RepID=A0A5S5C3K4_9BACL|nr:ABC transporter permease [Paenibacillus methanolicus]TYP74005.1 putative ABC transport system permease protein [Paenibacillus methanolicus]
MFLALREIRHAKARYALIALIMLLVSFLVLFVTGLARGLAYDNAASIQNMAATHFVLQEQSEHRLARSAVGNKELAAAREAVGDAQATPLGMRMSAVMVEGSSGKLDAALLAVDMNGWLSPSVAAGRTITGGAVMTILADRKLAESGAQVGGVIVDVATGIRLTIAGFVDDESFSHAPAVFISLDDWSAMQARTELAAGPSADASYNAIAVQASGDRLEALREALPEAEIITKADAVSAIPGYKEEQGSLLMMIVFLFVISAFVLAVFFYVITLQKAGQFGILKAIGTRTSYLAGSVIGQVLLLSTGSLAASSLLILLAQTALPASLPFRLETDTLLLTCALFLGMSAAGSLLSVAQVARTNALDAIGRAAG